MFVPYTKATSQESYEMKLKHPNISFESQKLFYIIFHFADWYEDDFWEAK